MRVPSIRSVIIAAFLIVPATMTSQFRHGAIPLVHPTSTSRYDRSAWLDVGRIKINLNNTGGLDNSALSGTGGAFWPAVGWGRYIVYDCGPWVVGKLNGVPMMGYSQWGSSYSPGPVINGQAALLAAPADYIRYRPYKIGHGDSSAGNPDYRDWPADLGAPVNPSGEPRQYGDQMVWSVFNNLDPGAPSSWWQTHMPTPGLPLEIQQMAYSHTVGGRTTYDLLANVVFLEWTIINKGDAPIESTYVSLWTDIDFNEQSDNKPAIDTVTQLGYCWQSRDYGWSIPKAVGFVWLYGPQVPSPGDSAVFRGKTRRKVRNLPITSFWGIQDDSFQDESFRGPAYSMRTAWNIARGYDKVGNPVLDSVTHQVTRFLYSGDPVSGTGWLCPHASGGAGFNIFSGPFTFAPHDTQWAMAALIATDSYDRLECVRQLRTYASTLRSMKYEDYTAMSPLEPPPPLPSSATLLQNFPNPFNPSTVIRFALPERTGVELNVYNTLGEKVATLVDGAQDAGFHEATFEGSRCASGVYLYRLKANGHSLTKRLVLLR